MNRKALYEKICKQWRKLYKIVNIKFKLDDYDLNVFRDHDVKEYSHIVWAVPMTLFQLISYNDKTSKFVDKYGYKVVLFNIAFLYIKYYSDELVTLESIWWQWELLCNNNHKMLDYEYLNKIERKLLKLMDYNIENWALGSSNMYEKYYSISDKHDRNQFIYSIIET